MLWDPPLLRHVTLQIFLFLYLNSYYISDPFDLDVEYHFYHHLMIHHLDLFHNYYYYYYCYQKNHLMLLVIVWLLYSLDLNLDLDLDLIMNILQVNDDTQFDHHLYDDDDDDLSLIHI